ncbi:hypothetical protein V2J09_020035 [Rumex salicifolius]
MARGKVQMKRIENKKYRQVTFVKRRSGLIKKALEISVLCDAQVALIIFSTKGNLFEFSSDSRMEKILERYNTFTDGESKLGSKEDNLEGNWAFEAAKFKAKIELLERNHRNYLGQDLDALSVTEIQSLEQKMDVAIKRIRARKEELMLESMSKLLEKEREMQEQNYMLLNKSASLVPPDKPLDRPPISWSERVSGERKTYHALLAKDDLWKAGKIKVSFPDGEDGTPYVTIAPDVMHSLYVAWSNSVVIKVLGKSVSHAIMDRRVRQMWNLKGRMTLMDIPNGYFVARFELEADFLYVLTEGPWMIFGNYIVVRQWDPLFRLETDIIHTTYAWVRLSGLSMVLYEEHVLFGIAAAIGNPIRVDLNTLTTARGKFARICVEINITKPLLGSIMVNDEKVFLEYEGLDTICYGCGMYGHLASAGGQLPISAQGQAVRDLGAWSVVQRNRRPRKDISKSADFRGANITKNSFAELRNLNEVTEKIVNNQIAGSAGSVDNEDPVDIERRTSLDLSKGKVVSGIQENTKRWTHNQAHVAQPKSQGPLIVNGDVGESAQNSLPKKRATNTAKRAKTEGGQEKKWDKS